MRLSSRTSFSLFRCYTRLYCSCHTRWPGVQRYVCVMYQVSSVSRRLFSSRMGHGGGSSLLVSAPLIITEFRSISISWFRLCAVGIFLPLLFKTISLGKEGAARATPSRMHMHHIPLAALPPLLGFTTSGAMQETPRKDFQAPNITIHCEKYHKRGIPRNTGSTMAVISGCRNHCIFV